MLDRNQKILFSVLLQQRDEQPAKFVAANFAMQHLVELAMPASDLSTSIVASKGKKKYVSPKLVVHSNGTKINFKNMDT